MTLTGAPRPPAGGQRYLLCFSLRYRRPPALCCGPSRPPAPPLGVRSPPARLRVPARGSLVRSPWRQEEGRGPAAPSPARLAGDQRAGGGTRRCRSCGPDCSSGPPALYSCCSGSWPAATPGGSRPGTLQPRGKRPAPLRCPAAGAPPSMERGGAEGRLEPLAAADPGCALGLCPRAGAARGSVQTKREQLVPLHSCRFCALLGRLPWLGPRGHGDPGGGRAHRSLPWSVDLGRGEPGTCHLVSRLAGFTCQRAGGSALAGPGPLRRRPVRGRGLFPCLGYAHPVDLGTAGVSGYVSVSACVLPRGRGWGVCPLALS